MIPGKAVAPPPPPPTKTPCNDGSHFTNLWPNCHSSSCCTGVWPPWSYLGIDPGRKSCGCVPWGGINPPCISGYTC